MKSKFILTGIFIISFIGIIAQPYGNYITMADGADKVVVPHSPYWDLPGDFTISMKVKFTNNTAQQMLMTHSSGGFEIDYTGAPLYSLWLSPTGYGIVFNASWIPTVNVWYHVVLTRQSGIIKGYVNGQLIGTSSYSGDFGTSTQPLRIGAYYLDNWITRGSIDEVSIWNIGVSQSFVSSILNYPLSGSESGLVAYWDMNEYGAGQGIIVKNKAVLTGNTLNAITTGTAITPYFSPQNALDFDGINDYVNVGNQPLFNMSSALTIEAWIYPEGPGSGGVGGSGGAIVNKEGEYEIARFSNGYIGWAFANTSPGWSWVQTTAYVPLNQWSHVAVTYGNNEVKTYLNGELVHTYPVLGTIGDVAPTYNDLWISGRQTVVNGQIFDGKMDEIRLWNVALSEIQIRENVYRELPSPACENGLVGYFNFNEVSGNTLPDFSGNHYNGTLTNMNPATDWVISTAPIPYHSIANGNWENNATWNTGQNAPVKAWSRVQVDHSISLNSAKEAIDVTISPTGLLTINQAQSLTVTSDLANANGVTGLVLKSGTTGTATLIENDGTEATVERYFSGNDVDWHLLSSPVSNAQSLVFTGKYLQRFDEPSNQYIEIVPTTYNLSPMQGFAVYGTSANNKVTFTGNLNAGSLSIPVTNSATAPYGWNLVGNPYASSIDWNMVIPTLSNIGSTIYYLEAATGNWLTWNGTTGSGSQYIPPMQGFFVSASVNSSLSITNAARTHTGSGLFYKDEIPYLTVIKASGNGLDDKTYIQFSETATPDFDPEKDGYKIISEINPALPQIFTTTMGKNLSINVLPQAEVIPLSFQVGQSGVYTINLEKATDIPVVILEDKKTGVLTDLKQAEYEFSYYVSDNQDRFNLHFSPLAISETQVNQILVYVSNNQVFVNDFNNSGGMITIYDMKGLAIIKDRSLHDGLNTIQVDVSSGFYLVKVTTGTNVKTEKIFIR